MSLMINRTESKGTSINSGTILENVSENICVLIPGHLQAKHSKDESNDQSHRIRGDIHKIKEMIKII